MSEKKIVKCVLGQRKKIARAMAIYAYDFKKTEPTWFKLPHKEAENLVDEADRHIEKLLDGGTIFPFVMDREVDK